NVVADTGDHAAMVQVAHAPGEHGHAAEARVGNEVDGGGRIQRPMADLGDRTVEALHAQPPLTGGSTAMATPAGSGSASRSTVVSLAKAEAFSSSGREPGQGWCAGASSASRNSATRAPSGTSSSSRAAGSWLRNAPTRFSVTFTPAPLR